MARMARVVSSDYLDFGCYKFWKEDRVLQRFIHTGITLSRPINRAPK